MSAAALLLALGLVQGAPRGAPRVAPEDSGITRAELEAHVRFLASDEMRGRATGTPECERAALGLADALKESAVAPAGDAGTFLQAVPLVRTKITERPDLVVRDARGEPVATRYGADFEVAGELQSSPASLRIVRFIGVGDLPAPNRSAALFLEGNAAQRRAWLKEAGQGRGDGWGVLLAPGSEERRTAKPLPDWRPVLQREGTARLSATVVTLHGPLLARVRAGEIASLSLDAKVEREQVTAHNVVGVVRGRASDAERRALVLSAHYDHIGVRSREPKSPDEDLIHNGADDDASGVAAVLELAEELAAGPAPLHDVVVLLAVGEEIGLLGTEHYLDHPLVPLERTLANLNFEMVGRPDALVGGAGVLWLTGHERTNLGAAFETAGIAIRADPRPKQNFYQRSDNYAFVQRGAIGQTFSSYDLHKDYHEPSDEADTLDYAHMETAVRSAYRAVRLVADGALGPKWTPREREPGAK